MECFWEGFEKQASVAGGMGRVLGVIKDEKKTDTYGRQIERMTSVIHKSRQPAHGNYYIWPDEL